MIVESLQWAAIGYLLLLVLRLKRANLEVLGVVKELLVRLRPKATDGTPQKGCDHAANVCMSRGTKDHLATRVKEN